MCFSLYKRKSGSDYYCHATSLVHSCVSRCKCCVSTSRNAMFYVLHDNDGCEGGSYKASSNSSKRKPPPRSGVINQTLARLTTLSMYSNS